MKINIRPNVAMNALPERNEALAGFYRSIEFDGKDVAPDFTILSPAPFGCYVVSWDPRPRGDAELCLQIETDDLDDLRDRIINGGGSIEFDGPDPNAPGRTHL